MAPTQSRDNPANLSMCMFFGAEKNHDSHRRDRIWRDFLHWIFRYFLQILGGSSYQNAHKYWRKRQKSSGKPPVETAPRNCRFLSLVVVELVLSLFFPWNTSLCFIFSPSLPLKGAWSAHSELKHWTFGGWKCLIHGLQNPRFWGQGFLKHCPRQNYYWINCGKGGSSNFSAFLGN